MGGMDSRLLPRGFLYAVLGGALLFSAHEPANAQVFGSDGFWANSHQWNRRAVRGYTRYDRRYRRGNRNYQQRANRRSKWTAPPAPQSFKVDENLKGPIQIVVSLPAQRVTVYKGGAQIATAPVSTGKAGHRTPSGIFSIIQKNRRHFSNLYGNAPMPYMQRITWSGVALHAGVLPGYPASHGCIRLPHGFARKLFGTTEMGAHVVIAQSQPELVQIAHANLFQPTPRSEILGLTADEADASAAESADTFGVTYRRTLAIEETGTPAPGAAVTQALGVMDAEAEIHRIRTYKLRSKAPLRVLITRQTAKERLKHMQRTLSELGYDPGPADGWVGKQTRAAIKSFQEDQGLPKTGTASEELHAALARASGKEDQRTGHLYVRQDFKVVFDAPVTIKDPDAPLGTHLYTAMHFEDEASSDVSWTALTLSAKAAKPKKDSKGPDAQPAIPATVVSAGDALDRIEVPAHIKRRISDMLTPGSSVVISDNGMSHETGKGTDFVVLTK